MIGYHPKFIILFNLFKLLDYLIYREKIPHSTKISIVTLLKIKITSLIGFFLSLIITEKKKIDTITIC